MTTPYYDHDGITLYHGDCRDILPEMPDASVDLVLTDPPYGIGFSGYESHDDVATDYAGVLLPAVAEAERLMVPGALAFFWQAMLHTHKWHDWFPNGYRIFAAAKNFVQYRPTPVQWSWDPVIFWQKGENTRKGIAGQRDFHLGNTNRWVARESNGHPCPRPLDTVEYIIGIASAAGQLVLDPFAGSGTTLVAAQQLGRRAIGIEIEERYCEIAAKRLEQQVLPFAPVEEARAPATGPLPLPLEVAA